MGGMRTLCREEKRELKVLADDFGLLDREEFLGRVAEVFIYQMDISHGGSVMWGIVRGMLEKLV